MSTYAVPVRPLLGIVLALASTLLVGVSAAPGDENESADRPLQQAAISAGISHTCAVAADGNVRCWGQDSEGQLGDGSATTGRSSVPVGPVALGQPARAVSAGSGFTCALLADRSVRCWGNDGSGELGNGAATTGTSSVPVAAVVLGQGARAITTGADHACALLDDGGVRCWGRNLNGQLGNGAPPSLVNDAPVAPVALGQGALAISAGALHTCALLVDASVRCWGYDNEGQLGDGPPTAPVNASPVAPVTLGQSVRAITAGGFHTCALLADRTVRCWGNDSGGALGDGPPTTNPNPAPAGVVVLGQGARSITADSGHTCALLVDDSVRCWGNDQNGQLGDGGAINTINPAPVGAVALGQPARAVTAGGLHTCALLADGTVRCWGRDADGQLGDGGVTPGPIAASPTGVVGMPSLASPDSADLSLTATTSAAAATVGDQVVLTITLANAGVDATTATIAAPLGAGLSPVSVTAAQGSYSTATGLWRAGAVPAAGTATLTLIARVVSPGTLVTTAEVVDAGARDPDSTPANDVAGEDDRAAATIAAAAVAAAAATPATPVVAAVRKTAPDRLTISLRPSRDTRAPFRFAPRATLLITKAPLSSACNGTITFTAKAATRTVLTQRAPLRLRNGVCAATTRTTLRRRPGKARTLSYAAAFAGNAALTSIRSRPKTAPIR